MIDLRSVAARAVARTGSAFVRRGSRHVRRRLAVLAGWSDEELRAACARALATGAAPVPARAREGLLGRLRRRLLPSRSAGDLVGLVALAVEVFRRAPADLEPGDRLYAPQIEAAIALTHRCVIQMDTGEGKTYALLPAAFALACRFPKVYVVCASDYLAERDARRTLPFWDGVGLRPGLGLKGGDPAQWGRRVVYTTLPALTIKAMLDDVASDPPSYPLARGAVLVDEADAVLIDSAFQPYEVVERIEGEAFDWARAVMLSQGLVDGEHVRTDLASLHSTLTLAGEAHVREQLGPGRISDTQYLMMRHAIELAHVATRVVREDRDFVVEAGRIFAINRLTGRIERNVSHDWIIPLSVLRGLPIPPAKIPLDRLWPTSLLLDAFDHLAGLSGTVEEDAVEYLISYRFLPTVVIPPRKPRHKGVQRDLCYRTAREACVAIAELVEWLVERGQPVLIGTQTIVDAEKVHEVLTQHAQGRYVPVLLTGKNEADAAEIFAGAGRPGSVLVATQLAGRGVDIRLTDAAREAGGLAAIGAGHSVTARHDRQFVGRAGRQGERFFAQFICSVEDPLFQMFRGERMSKWFERFGVGENVAVEHRWLDTGIRKAQKKYWWHEFRRRAQATYASFASTEARARIMKWFELCRIVDEETPGHPAVYFVDQALDRFVGATVRPVFGRAREISFESAAAVIEQIREALAPGAVELRSDDVVGMHPNDAADIIRARIKSALQAALQRVQSWEIAARKEASDAWVTYQTVARTFPASPAMEVPGPADGLHEAAAQDKAWLPLAPGGEEAAAAEQEHRERLDAARSRLWHAAARAALFRERWPRAAGYAVVRRAWSDHINSIDRLQFQMSLAPVAILDRMRLLRQRIALETDRAEAKLAQSLLRTWLLADRPELLDDVFVLEDRRVEWQDKPQPERPPAAIPPGRDEPAPASGPKIEDLVAQFVAHHGPELTAPSFSTDLQRRTLTDFLTAHPLHALRRPDQIERALRDWLQDRAMLGVASAARKLEKRALEAFLAFLRERTLIGPLPLSRHKLAASWESLTSNLTQLRVILPLLGIGALALAALGLSQLTLGTGEAPMPGFVAYLDELVFAGALRTGMLAGLVAGALAAGAVLGRLLNPPVGLADQLTGLGAVISWVVLGVAVAFCLAEGGIALDPWALSWLVSAILVCVAALRLATGAVLWIQHDTGISLFSVWFCATSLLVLDRFAQVFPAQAPIAVGAFAGVWLLHTAWRRLSRGELTFMSVRVTGPVAMQAENVPTAAIVEGDVGIAPHVLGVATAWSLLALVPTEVMAELPSWSRAAAAFGVYAATAVLVTGHLLRARLVPARWQVRASERHEVYLDSGRGATLEATLARLRQRLFAAETLLVLVLGGAFLVGTMIRPLGRPGSIPLELFLLLAAIVFASQSQELVESTVRFLLNRGGAVSVTLETFQLTADLDEPESFADRMKRLWEHNLVKLFGVILLVLNAINYLGDALKHLLDLLAPE